LRELRVTLRAATLSGRTVATINAAARVMYPHSAVPEAVYARVGDTLAETAHDDSEAARTLEEGAAALDDGRRPFAERSVDEQLAALKAIEGSEFFKLVRTTAVVEVYSDARTWQVLGYEGPSFDRGGYIDRGFDDLDWLPDPEQAS
jgi:hypothetical protein